MSRRAGRTKRRPPRIAIQEFKGIAPVSADVVFRGRLGLALLSLAIAVTLITALVHVLAGGFEHGTIARESPGGATAMPPNRRGMCGAYPCASSGASRSS